MCTFCMAVHILMCRGVDMRMNIRLSISYLQVYASECTTYVCMYRLRVHEQMGYIYASVNNVTASAYKYL